MMACKACCKARLSYSALQHESGAWVMKPVALCRNATEAATAAKQQYHGIACCMVLILLDNTRWCRSMQAARLQVTRTVYLLPTLLFSSTTSNQLVLTVIGTAFG